MGKRQRTPPAAAVRASEPFNNPFSRLAERLDGGTAAPPASRPELVAHGRADQPEESAPGRAGGAGEQPAPGKAPARAVVRLERKGRGGKEATIVEKLDLSPAELERWLKELKRALGCGGAIEGGALALQGDLRDRVKALLEQRGVRRVTV
jgi:translation initiation factor 1